MTDHRSCLSAVKANMEAAEQDRLSEIELLGQMSCVLIITPL